MGLPLDTPPMEAASAATLLVAGGPWQYETKWDGFRCFAFKADDAVELRAKSGKPLGRYFPEVVSMLRELPFRSFVIDGELVIEIDGHLGFHALQMRLHLAESRIRKLSAATPARLTLFDMLIASDGTRVMDLPLAKRRQALEGFAREAGDNVMLSPATREPKQADKWLGEAGEGSTDGVVAKRMDEIYRLGQRAMVKVKKLRTADCVVGGFRYGTSSREVGSLLLGLYNEAGELDHVGFTSTIAESEREALTRRLEALRGKPSFTGKSPGGPSRWSTDRSDAWEPLRPELVVESSSIT